MAESWKDLWEEVSLPEFERKEDLIREIFEKIDYVGDAIYDAYKNSDEPAIYRCNEALEMLSELEALVRQLVSF